ncbi:MAG: hypothetical protein WC889_20045 [Myxococcota bacterium]|jgi:hypothetical protein
MSKLIGLKDLVQDAIDKGATSVEQVQLEIARKPLEIIEQIEPLKPLATSIREIHKASIGSVYDTIRTINKQVGEMAGEYLKMVEGKKEK